MEQQILLLLFGASAVSSSRLDAAIRLRAAASAAIYVGRSAEERRKRMDAGIEKDP